ncbi:hypothetical protein DM806_21540 [Sphingobium lactosutens]|uniref:hypothetical protein n=1 Tax=Sphingobium lactosutens TaxID=522773 RepID=UPI0015BE5BD2|nr:hypothetical protein [Sphingobium lactosutens]NWK98199.1 hypothetical protein [Sphingobium lactosutens]
MTCQFPPLPQPSGQIREDGWSPARQRRFLETLASCGVVQLACESVRITARSAYNLRIRRDGAAFRLGWDAAILIARARLADDLLARAITGCTDTIRRDEENFEVTRHRHDNRLAMSMLSRLDRMADSPPEGSDAALARVVAQDFVAFLDLICPEQAAVEEADRLNLPRPGPEPEATHLNIPSAREMADARMLDGDRPDTPEPVEEDSATALSPGASVALFIAARLALNMPQKPPVSETLQRCELRPQHVNRATLPPEEAAARLRGIWWDEDREGWRTDYPAPPGFDGEESDAIYDIDDYERDLTPQEEEALAIRDKAERRPYEDAAARARDAFFGFVTASGAAAHGAMATAAGHAATG